MFLFICHGELNMDREYIQPGFKDILDFMLMDALFGRRARRFFMGASIQDGYFEYKSKHDPLPLTEKEQIIILSAAAGNTGWHNLIMRGERYELTFQTTHAVQAGAHSHMQQAFIRASCFLPMIPGFTFSRRGMPQN
jgi:hypothetical protein